MIIPNIKFENTKITTEFVASFKKILAQMNKHAERKLILCTWLVNGTIKTLLFRIQSGKMVTNSKYLKWYKVIANPTMFLSVIFLLTVSWFAFYSSFMQDENFKYSSKYIKQLFSCNGLQQISLYTYLMFLLFIIYTKNLEI